MNAVALARERRDKANATTKAKRDEEIAWWDGIKLSNDQADFRAYLARYPEGQFASIARQKLEESETRKVASAIPLSATLYRSDGRSWQIALKKSFFGAAGKISAS